MGYYVVVMNSAYVWKNRLGKFIDHPGAVWPFLRKRLFYNRVADSYLKYYEGIKFLSYEETVERLLTENVSIVRFGDDVFDMLLGIGLYYDNWRQVYDRKLAERLKEVLASREEKLLVCFNPELVLKSKKEFEAMGIPEQYHFWTHSKIYMKDYVHKSQVYGSALSFQERYNKTLPYERIISHLSGKHLIIVASNTARFGGAAFGRTTDYVEGPSSNAWSAYDTLLSQVRSVASNYPKEEVLIMTSLGPTSKVMALDLTREGYTVWDTGQFFDLALKRLQ